MEELRGGCDGHNGNHTSLTALTVYRFTLIFMEPTNNALLAQIARTTFSEIEVRALVEKWGSLNLLRSGMPFVGTALGLYGAL
ncbi:MAG: hypothetical protein Q9205_006026 [Flavoplaca limonia]